MPDRAPVRLRRTPHAIRLACALVAALAGARAQAGAPPAVWRIDDVAGEIHLSDAPDAPAGTPTQCIAGDCGPRPEAPARRVLRYEDLVQRAADRQHLAAALVHAVIAVESGYRPRALSPRGAAGLMQLMPATAARYGVTDVFDPAQNIDAGTRHLRTLLDRYGQDAPSALAAYNAGSARARWRNAETAAYVPAVLLRAAMPNPKVSP